MTKISIIIPVFNSEKYIKRCVNSILNQTFKAFELILVNDGSSDKSGDICDILASNDNRIKVIHKKNGGVSSARNQGLDVAKGNYIMFCDSDDYVEPEWCQKSYDLMEKSKVSMGICCYQTREVDTWNIKCKQIYSNELQSIVARNEFWKIYMNNLLNMPWNKIFLSTIIRENNIRFDEKLQYNEDLLFVLKYIQCSEGTFGISNMPLYNYVQGIDGSLTRRYVSDLWNIKKRVFKEMDKTLFQCGINLQDIKTEYYNKWIWAIVFSMNNNVLKKDEKGISVIIDENNKILKSKECQVAFENGSFEAYHPLFAFLLKKRNYILILLFEHAVYIKKNWKRMRKHEKNCNYNNK